MNVTHFLPRVIMSPKNGFDLFLRKPTTDESRLNFRDMILQHDISMAFSQLKKQCDLWFYPSDKEYVNTVWKEAKTKLGVLDNTKAWKKNLLSPTHVHCQEEQFLPQNRFLQDVYFLDCESQLFEYAKYVRQIACINLKGDRCFKTAVKYLSDIHPDYRKVAHLSNETFESSSSSSYNNNNTLLVASVKETEVAPAFAEAMIDLLKFLKAKLLPGSTPLLLFQGSNVDPTWLKFCYESKSEAIMPIDKQKELNDLLIEVRPRFASVDMFWRNLKSNLKLSSFSHALPRFTTYFFPKPLNSKQQKTQQQQTKDFGYTIEDLRPRLRGLIRKLLEEASGSDSFPTATPTAVTCSTWEKEKKKEESMLYTQQTAFRMQYVIDEDDVTHHEADSDCMILRNATAAMLLFHSFMGKIQPYLKNVLLALSLVEEVEEINLHHIMATTITDNQTISGYMTDVVVFLCDSLTGFPGRENQEYRDEVLQSRYMDFFFAFLGTFRDPDVLRNFETQHIPYTEEMATMLLVHCMTLPLVVHQRPSSGYELLQVNAEATQAAVRHEKQSSNSRVILDKRQMQVFLDTFKEGVQFKIDPKSTAAWQSVKHDYVVGRYDYTRIQQLMREYMVQNQNQKNKLNDNELMALIYERRNWPLFYSDTLEKRKKNTSFRLHHRLCHLFLTNIHAQMLSDKGDWVHVQLRCYKKPVTLKSDRIYKVFSEGVFVFCKDCKRFVTEEEEEDDDDKDQQTHQGYTLRRYLKKHEEEHTNFEDWKRDFAHLFDEVKRDIYTSLPKPPEIDDGDDDDDDDDDKPQLQWLDEQVKPITTTTDLDSELNRSLKLEQPTAKVKVKVKVKVKNEKNVKRESTHKKVNVTFQLLQHMSNDNAILLSSHEILQEVKNVRDFVVKHCIPRNHNGTVIIIPFPHLHSSEHITVTLQLQRLAVLFTPTIFRWFPEFIDIVLDLACRVVICMDLESKMEMGHVNPEIFLKYFLFVQFQGPHAARKITYAQKRKAQGLLAIRMLMHQRPKWKTQGWRTFTKVFHGATLHGFVTEWESQFLK